MLASSTLLVVGAIASWIGYVLHECSLHPRGCQDRNTTRIADRTYTNENGQTRAVIVLITLWRELESGRETAHLSAHRESGLSGEVDHGQGIPNPHAVYERRLEEMG